MLTAEARKLIFLVSCTCTLLLTTSVVPSHGQLLDDQDVRVSKFGFAFDASRHQIVIDTLVRHQAFDLAVSQYKLWLTDRSADDRRLLADAMGLLRVSTLRSLNSGIDLTLRYDVLESQALRAALLERQLFEQRQLSSADGSAVGESADRGSAELFLDFAIESSRLELARYVIANKLATIGNDRLNQNSLEAIRSSLDSLESLNRRATDHAVRIAQRTESREANVWAYEHQRLTNEIQLLIVDALALRFENATGLDEPEQVAAASALLTAIDQAELKVADVPKLAWTLQILRSKADAKLGRSVAAIGVLNEQAKEITEPTILLANRLVVIELLTEDANNAEKLEQARRILSELLFASDSVSPSLALAVYRYNLARVSQLPETTVEAPNQMMDANDLISAESLGRSLSRPIDRTYLTGLKDALATSFGNYWRFRAEAIFLREMQRMSRHGIEASTANSTAGLTTNSSLEMLDAEVSQDLLANRPLEAIKRLEFAEEQQIKAGHRAEAFSYSTKRIAVLHKLFVSYQPAEPTRQSIEARLELARRCNETATKYADQPSAVGVSQLAIALATEALPHSDLVTGKAEEALTSICQQHVNSFPNADGTFAIVQLLETLACTRNDLRQAILHWQNFLTAIEDSNSTSMALKQKAIDRQLSLLVLDRLLNVPNGKIGDAELLASNDVSTNAYRASLADATQPTYWSEKFWHRSVSMQQPTSKSIEATDPHRWIAELAEEINSIAISGTTIKPINLTDVQASHDPLIDFARDASRLHALAGRICSSVNDVGPSERQSFSELLQRFKSHLDNAGLQRFNGLMRNCMNRFEAIDSILNGHVEQAIGQWKVYVNENQQPTNLDWLPRLLAMGDETRQREAANFLKSFLMRRYQDDPQRLLTATAEWIDVVARRDGQQAGLERLELIKATRQNLPDGWVELVSKRIK